MSNYKQQFLNVLRAAGPNGVPNYELSKIALQYNRVIHYMRKEGYDIRYHTPNPNAPHTNYYYLVEKEIPWATTTDRVKRRRNRNSQSHDRGREGNAEDSRQVSLGSFLSL